MPIAPVHRKGDPNSHGGVTLQGSPTTFAEGIPVARIGDTATCPIHGTVTHVEGGMVTFADVLNVCRVGDKLSCGAVCLGASPSTFAE